ncbi:MAG: sugar phosphate isomerase/epimerase family protein [Lacipirellulaceae bacterium]
MSDSMPLDRRRFVSHSLRTVGAAALASPLALAAKTSVAKEAAASAAASAASTKYEIIAFTKFLQDLSYDELADTIKDLGFEGVEATVRNKGHVLPERVEEDLPKLVEALDKRDLKVVTMASDVLNPQQPLTEKVLKTAVSLGIKSYRMGFYKYDLKKPILPQLEEIRPQVEELAAFNKELGIGALYQNHSDAKYVGATIWDLHWLLKDIPVDQVGSAFDIRHTTIEAGLSWPVLYDVIKPHIGALFVKDFNWDGKKAKHVPLGTGRVDPKFFDQVKKDGFSGPISLHVEYLGKEGTQANIDALRRDLKVLRGWLT